MKTRSAIAAIGILFSSTIHIAAADLVEPDVPEPSASDERGIWAAIAYSDVDAKHGFFWGADKRQEALDEALAHCQNAGGKACSVMSVFRNHRHWDDDDNTGFPYNHCGALAVAKQRTGQSTPAAAISAPTRKEAEDAALQRCEASAGPCSIREWACT